MSAVIKVVRVIDAKVIKARCEASREARKAEPLTWRPFATALKGVKVSKAK